MQSLGVDIQRAINKHQIRSIVYFILSIINILVSIPLIHKLGATGAALGTTISIVIGNGLIMNIVYKKYIGLDVLEFWEKMIPIISSAIIPIVVGLFLNRLLPTVCWANLIIKGVFFVFIFVLSE